MWRALVGSVGYDDLFGLLCRKDGLRHLLHGDRGRPRSQVGAPIPSLVQLLEPASLSWVIDLPVAGFVGADSLQFA